MLRKDRFDEREADFYEALYTQSQACSPCPCRLWLADDMLYGRMLLLVPVVR